MGYELRRSDVYDLVRTLGEDYRERGDELYFKYCPYCHGGQHNDKHTFAINLQSGAYQCFRATCGAKGHFVELCRDVGYRLPEHKDYTPSKAYRKLPQTPITVRDNAIAYLQTRGISEGTARRYNITTQANNPNVVVFPFYDESNTLQFVKYRNADYVKGQTYGSKEWCEKDTKPILFGMNQCEDFTTLVVTEGQLDSLSLSDAGIKNAVSVPTGAKGMSWLQHCYEWVDKFDEIIIMGDCEHGKVTLVDEFNLRLPHKKVRVVPQECYLGEKDANDIYRKYGADALRVAIHKAEVIPINAVKRLADVQNVDTYNMERITTGINFVDRTIGGFYFGQVILLTGKRGEGKSTFMSQLGCEALNQGYNCYFYSGELTDYHFKDWMVHQLAGGSHLTENKTTTGDTYYTVPQDVCKSIDTWLGDKAYIYDNNYIDDELPNLEDTIVNVICRYNVRFICIDNLMTALECDTNCDLYRKQSEFVRNLKRVASKYNVCILLVAHPRKESGNEARGFQNDDISGSADITNRVDVVMVYSRAKPKEGVTQTWDSELIITKNRLTGKLITPKHPIKLEYSQKSKRIVQLSDTTPKTYGWESTQPILYEEPPF
jgi:twinkle protein